MAIPDFQSFLLPVLQFAATRDVRVRDLLDPISEKFNLTEEDRNAPLPSGKRTVVASRLYWALYYLARAGMLDNNTRGVYSITPTGRELLDRGLERITAKILREESLDFAAFYQNQNKLDDSTDSGKSDESAEGFTEVAVENPEETLDHAYGVLCNALKEQLLQRVDALTPVEFEHLIIALVRGLGYCGERGSVKHIGGPGDGGVDGVVFQDRLELERVYLQAKKFRSDHKIDTGTMNAFVGALAVKKAQKGVFVTTSFFTPSAEAIAHDSPYRIALIDRNKLGDLMFDCDIGIQAKQDSKAYVLKEIDGDFFDDLGER